MMGQTDRGKSAVGYQNRTLEDIGEAGLPCSGEQIKQNSRLNVFPPLSEANSPTVSSMCCIYIDVVNNIR